MRRLITLISIVLVVVAALAAGGVVAGATSPPAARTAPSTPPASDTHLSCVKSADPVRALYGSGDYVFDTVELSGSALAGTSILSVGDLETLATDGSLGLGCRTTYSLLTSGAVFSKSAFSGVKLYDLLVRLGLSTSAASSTPVRVYAADGYCLTFTLAQIRESSRYSCYAAKGDSTVEEAGVPVLLSFASASVPLIGPTGDDAASRIFTVAEGYDAAADNVGGPIRLTIGQTSVDDFNARYSAKWVTKVVVGDATEPTHTGDYALLAATELTVEVHDNAGPSAPLDSETLTVGTLEGYASSLMTADYCEDDGPGGYYAGVDLWKLLVQKLGLPSHEGTATFVGAGGATLTVDLAYLRNLGGDYAGYTTERTAMLLDGDTASLDITDVHPLLAFAKNGYPLVASAGDAGYLASGVAGAVVDNDGGPLALLLPADGTYLSGPACLGGVTSIELDLDLPTDIHSGDTYGDLATREVVFAGNGLDDEVTLTVAELEKRIELMVTHDYGAVPGAAGCTECHPGATASSPTGCLSCHSMDDVVAIHGGALACVSFGPTGSYHGLDLLHLLESSPPGLAVDAEYVTVTGSDGTFASFTLGDLESAEAPVLLAFSRAGKPLVANETSAGYDAAADNAGGPIVLVSETRAVEDVASVTVTRKAGVWTHDEAPYSACLNRALTISGSEVDGTTILSLAQIEALPYVRDSFAASKGESAWQGAVLRDLIVKRLAGGVSKPSKITVYGADGYGAALSVDDVLDGIDSTYQPGEHRDVILAYSKDGRPLVTSSISDGYVPEIHNDGGPVHLVVENTISSWVKDVRAIVVGDGDPVYAPDRVASTAARIVSPTASQSHACVARGSRLALRALLTPSDSTDDVTWKSSARGRARVSAEGVVTARARGVAVITATTSSGHTDRFVVHVTRRRNAVSIRLPASATVTAGETTRLVALISPRTSTSRLRWKSSDTAVATVDRGGTVTARQAGTVTITVTTSNGKRSRCKVTVEAAS